MSGVMKPYIVRQGDYLAKLAFVLGFDADEVWNDPANEDLKKLRPDPDILAPGDILYVPDKPPPDGLPIEKGTENGYAATVPKVEFTVILQDETGQPIANEPYELQGLGDPASGTTGADGSVTVAVPLVTREVVLTLPQRGFFYPIGVGDLDPIEESSGVRQRLRHLGYVSDYPATATEEAQKIEDRCALMRFQFDRGLPPSGEIDDATLQALIGAHGS